MSSTATVGVPGLHFHGRAKCAGRLPREGYEKPLLSGPCHLKVPLYLGTVRGSAVAVWGDELLGSEPGAAAVAASSARVCDGGDVASAKAACSLLW